MSGSLFRLGGWKPARPAAAPVRPASAFRRKTGDASKAALQARIDADPRFTAPGPLDHWWKGDTDD
jgi:hypothetical protein